MSLSSVASPSLPLLKLNVHLSCRSQISVLITNEVSTKVFDKYFNFANIFSLDLVSKLPEHTGITDYAIELVIDQQLPYKPIYSLGLVELETMKVFIKTNLANRFIKLSKLPIGTPVWFDQKSDGSLWLCVNY